MADNRFRKAMHGHSDTIAETSDGAVAGVGRGRAGEALVNFSSETRSVEMPTALPDGEYTDAVHGSSFTVSDGTLKGTLAPLTSYILFAK